MTMNPAQSIRRSAAVTLSLLGAALVLLGVNDARYRRRRFAPIKQYVLANVPAAAGALSGGGAFVRASDGIRTTKPQVVKGASASIAAAAPATATGAFDIAAAGAGSHASIRFRSLSAAPAQLDDGAVVYRNVLPDVDLVAVDDKERLELAFVIDKLTVPPSLILDATPPAGGGVRHEAQTNAIVLTDPSGRARFRISAPVAIDAKGEKRLGTYEATDGGLRIAMNWDGLVAPIVVDPSVTIPFWSILADGRGPGARMYDADSLSREPHVAFDSARGKALLVRPVRSKQFEDTLFQFGDVSRGVHEGPAQRIAPQKRTPSSGIVGSAEATAEWLRGYSLTSETWEWNGAAWLLRDTAALPGVIDPALAFDAKRGRTVLFGGAHPGLDCTDRSITNTTSSTPFYCSNADLQDVTYEFDGNTWVAKYVAGSPSPRLRSAMAWDAARELIVLFGGRELDTSDSSRRVLPYGPVFPENFTRDLLNDTWTYDGISWKRVPTATPPPGLESAQLVYDSARKVMVLIGGRSSAQLAGKTDALAIWEFDGTDWVEKVRAGDPNLPLSLRSRRGAAAFWNAARNRLAIFGGNVDKVDGCTLTDAEIATQVASTASDPVARQNLASTGCLGGYLHDFWEWNGSSFTQTAATKFGGSSDGTWVFQQASGGTAWLAGGAAPTPTPTFATGGTPLLPWRYDQRADHFAPRTRLERSHVNPASTAPSVGASPVVSSPTSTVSPLFASRTRPDVVFNPATGSLNVFTAPDGAVYRADGAVWAGGVPRTTPFSDGPNDFYAAAWDSASQKLVLFDPRTAKTWTHSDASGWQVVVTAGTSPPQWTVAASVRVKADVDIARDQAASEDGRGIIPVMRQAPRMVYDRARSVTVMLYGGATWEFDGANWATRIAPPGWSSCTAATVVAYDGARAKTIAYGCSVPATTWEWNGSAWAGPFESPYKALVWRDRGDLTQTQFDYLLNWKATLQAAWAHPNAAFESTGLGGVSMIDADGTTRTWNGATWAAGARISNGYTCFVSSPTGMPFDAQLGLRFMSSSYPWPVPESFNNTMTGKDYLPMCFFPPAVEDTAHRRVLAFRDGPRGLLELPLDAPTAWRAAVLGRNDTDPPWGGVSLTSVHPYPFELLSAEHAYFKTLSDPATRVRQDGNTTATFEERRVPNLWWPYRIINDPTTNRIRLLTNRGVLWELGGEEVNGLGGACESNVDCLEGTCTSEKVCCDTYNCGDQLCTTCKGPVPGQCQLVATGGPEPRGRCGAGECGGVCAGNAAACVFDALRHCGPATFCATSTLTPGGHCAPNQAACVLSGFAAECPIINGQPDLTALVAGQPCAPPPAACSGALTCADSTSCKVACATRSDCADRYSTCVTGGSGCAPDRASSLATSLGVTPLTVNLPPLYSAIEAAGMLIDAGMPHDDAGRILLRDISHGPLTLAFDPNRKTPMRGFRKCLERVYVSLIEMPTASVDAVVAGLPRCVSSTPWHGDDPSGEDCCPELCLTAYFEARESMEDWDALKSIRSSGCYPTDQSPSETDAGPSDSAADGD